MEFFESLQEILFPSRCISCGALGLSICSRCRRGWNPHIYISKCGDLPTNHISVTSSVIYSTVAQKVILGAKESHLKSCDILVSQAITHALENVLKSHQVDVLVPIPSRKSAARQRGRQFISAVSQEASTRHSIPLASPLVHTRKVRDQSGLHLQERWNNLEGAFVVEKEHGLRGNVVLIDDLVTTGATLCEAARALRYAGIQVIGAVTAAVAQPLR